MENDLMTLAILWFPAGFAYGLWKQVEFLFSLADWSRQQSFASDWPLNRLRQEECRARILRNSVQQRHADVAFTTLLGFAGIGVACFTWLVNCVVRNWPECLVIGGHPKDGERFNNLCEKPWMFWIVFVVTGLIFGPRIGAPIAVCWMVFWVGYNLRRPQPAPAAPVATEDGNVSRDVDYYSQRYGNR